MLISIWFISLGLSLISIMVMLVLVVRRFISDREQAKYASLQKQLRQQLISFTADHDEDALIVALGKVPPSVAVEASFAFLELLRGEDRTEIVWALAAAGLPDHIRQRLKSGNEAQRLSAAEFLTAFSFPETRVALVEALHKGTREVRIAASISLARLNWLPPLPEVLQAIGPNGQRSRRLIDLFHALSTERSDEIIAVAVDGQRPAFLRASAIDALGRMGQYQFIEAFEEMAQVAEPEVAAAAVRAIGLIGHPRSAEAVVNALKSEAWEVRLEAAEAARKIGVQQARDGLIDLLGDDEWTVRYMAAKSLLMMGGDNLLALETAAMGEASRRQRTASLVLAEGIER